jgi:hypothetical protein
MVSRCICCGMRERRVARLADVRAEALLMELRDLAAAH